MAAAALATICSRMTDKRRGSASFISPASNHSKMPESREDAMSNETAKSAGRDECCPRARVAFSRTTHINGFHNIMGDHPNRNRLAHLRFFYLRPHSSAVKRQFVTRLSYQHLLVLGAAAARDFAWLVVAWRRWPLIGRTAAEDSCGLFFVRAGNRQVFGRL